MENFMEAQNRKRKPTIFLFGILGRFMLVSKFRVDLQLFEVLIFN